MQVNGNHNLRCEWTVKRPINFSTHYCDTYYRPQRSCGKVMFLHLSVILSTGGGGCIPACTWATTPLGRHPPPQADTPCPPARHPRVDTPSGRHPPQQAATAADGTHPTGMHSCLVIIFEYRLALCRWLNVCCTDRRPEQFTLTLTAIEVITQL